MVRGTAIFICDECGKKFVAPDVEYMATVYSAPQFCPQCGSLHTMPAGIGSLLGKMNPKRAIYKKIWKNLDNKPPI